MAKLSDLVQCISEATGIPVATVREIGRRLRQAGLIGTGKGGRYGGADMTPKDAASLLTGLLISRVSSVSFSELASETEDHLKGLTAHTPRGHQMVSARWDRRLELSELSRLQPGHSFGDGLAALIASFVNAEFERRMSRWGWVDFSVNIHSPRALVGSVPQPEALIEFETETFGSSNLFYIRRRSAKSLEVFAPRKWSDIVEDPQFDLIVAARIQAATLKSVSLLLRNSGQSNG
jgi:hypothetical protein